MFERVLNNKRLFFIAFISVILLIFLIFVQKPLRSDNISVEIANKEKATLWNTKELSELEQIEISFILQNDKASDNLQKINALLADSPESRERGLMFIEELGEYEGMLFKFETPSIQSFWMKNTLIPLDIIFVNQDLKVTDVYHNTKPLQTKERYTSSVQVLYAIEVNGGFAKYYGITKGDVISLKQSND